MSHVSWAIIWRIAKTFGKWLGSNQFLALYLSCYFFVIVSVTLHRWWQFEYYYFDHGIFDQSLWSVSRGQAPLIDHFDDKGWINQLGDHFTPSLYLLTPIYWLTTRYEPLIILQNVFVVASAAVLWLLARKLKIYPWLGASLLIAFTWFLGLQNTLIAGFHTELPALLMLALVFYFLEQKNWKWYWLLLVVTLGFKETFAPIGIGIGLYLFLKKQWLQGMTTILFSILYFLLVIYWVIPALSGQPYNYAPPAESRALFDLLQQFFLPSMKLQTLSISLLTFGLLPLVEWMLLPLILQDFFIRFVLSRGNFTWDFGFHYSAMISIILFYAALKGAERLQKLKRYTPKISILHALFIFMMVVFFHYHFRGSLGLAYNKTFYSQTAHHQFLQDFVEAIPSTGLTMTQNNIAVRLTHSNQVMLLRDRYWRWQPEIIALDIREGQNPNNYWPIDSKELYNTLLKDPNYQLFEISPDQVYFTKKSNFDPEFYVTAGWEIQ